VVPDVIRVLSDRKPSSEDPPDGKMAAAGKATIRSSGRTVSIAKASNDLFARAEVATRQLAEAGYLTHDRKIEISTIIDELIKKAKETTPANLNKTTTVPKKTYIEAEIQTDKPMITVNYNDIKPIDKKQDFIINLLQREKTYAEALRGPQLSGTTKQQTPAATERLNKAKKDLAQYEISITTAGALKSVQELIQSSPHKNIMKAFQEMIDDAKLEGKPQLESVAKLKRGIIRLRAITTDGAKAIREANIDRNTVYEGIKIYQPRYGIVIHGISVWSINLNAGYEDKGEYRETIES